MSCKKYVVLFSVDTVGETGNQLGSDGTDIAALTWQVLDVAKNQVSVNCAVNNTRAISSLGTRVLHLSIERLFKFGSDFCIRG